VHTMFSFGPNPDFEEHEVDMTLHSIYSNNRAAMPTTAQITIKHHEGTSDTTMRQLSDSHSKLSEQSFSASKTEALSANIGLALPGSKVKIGASASTSYSVTQGGRTQQQQTNVEVNMTQHTCTQWVERSTTENLGPGQSIYAYQWMVHLPGGITLHTDQFFTSPAKITNLPTVKCTVSLPKPKIFQFLNLGSCNAGIQGWSLSVHGDCDMRNTHARYAMVHAPGWGGNKWELSDAGGGLVHIKLHQPGSSIHGWEMACHDCHGDPRNAHSSFLMIHRPGWGAAKFRIVDSGNGSKKIVLVQPGSRCHNWEIACHAHAPSGDYRNGYSWRAHLHDGHGTAHKWTMAGLTK